MADNELQNNISLKEALALAHRYGFKITKATLTEWLDTYYEKHKKRLYHQPKGVGGKIYVFEAPFIAFLSGKREEA